VLRRPAVVVSLLAALVAVVVGLALFQPWKLWVDTTVDEAAPPGLPPVAAAPADTQPEARPGAEPGLPAGTPADTPAVTGSPTDQPAAPTATAAEGGPVVLAHGVLITHEHPTSGTVRIIELPDHSRLLRLDDLDTSNGPNLHVWLSDAQVVAGSAGWHVFDDGAHLDLGSLKGNRGSQNYPVPADADLSRYVSVTIWCDRFNVSFGAAQLAAG
jgi:hypothetical protein